MSSYLDIQKRATEVGLTLEYDPERKKHLVFLDGARHTASLYTHLHEAAQVINDYKYEWFNPAQAWGLNPYEPPCYPHEVKGLFKQGGRYWVMGENLSRKVAK